MHAECRGGCEARVHANGLLEAAHPEGEPSMACYTARLGWWEEGRMEGSEDTVKAGA